MLTLEEIFPPFGLRISCGPVTLRVLRDDDLPEVVELVRGGIQAPGLPMPFLLAWHQDPFAPGTPGWRGGGRNGRRSRPRSGVSRWSSAEMA